MLFTTTDAAFMLTENILDPKGSIVASKRFEDPFDGNYYFYNYDLRGSVTSIIVPTDIALTGGGTLQGGSRVTDYTYDEFGNLEKGGVQEFLNETTYTGSVSDTSTGLQYMNARYYDPETGRFLTQDTYTGNPYDPWTQHLYAYCGNNPTSMVDPTGHDFFQDFITNTVKSLKNLLHSAIKSAGKTKYSAESNGANNRYREGYKAPRFNKKDTYQNSGYNIFASREIAMWAGIAIVVGGEIMGAYEARDAFLHYVGCSGETRIFNLRKAYGEDDGIKHTINSEIAMQKSAVSGIGKTKQDGIFIASRDVHKNVDDPSTTDDWQKTLGSFQITGTVVVLKKGNDYAMLSLITAYDRYNFDDDYPDPLSYIGQMAQSGAASNYDHYGYYFSLHSWTTGG